VVNITDVWHAVSDADTGEDKMEVAAARERRSVLEIADFYTKVFFEDLAALNVLPADAYPRASAYVPQLIADRARAREERDWPRADRIRAELDALGVDLTDTSEGPVWHLR
jgi:cysteinyl-tRNA synthetase